MVRPDAMRKGRATSTACVSEPTYVLEGREALTPIFADLTATT
jgi:hypothetical protein